MHLWYSEKVGETRDGSPTFTICCQQGRVKLPPMRKAPPYLEDLVDNNPSFRRLIRVYNSVLAFTSIGAKSITSGNGPPGFSIQGQKLPSHRVTAPTSFLQMYIYDTENEVANRINTMGRRNTQTDLNVAS